MQHCSSRAAQPPSYRLLRNGSRAVTQRQAESRLCRNIASVALAGELGAPSAGRRINSAASQPCCGNRGEAALLTRHQQVRMFFALRKKPKDFCALAMPAAVPIIGINAYASGRKSFFASFSSEKEDSLTLLTAPQLADPVRNVTHPQAAPTCRKI